MISEYVVIDLEMTGLSPRKDKIMEIGSIKIKDGAVIDEFQTLINPNVEIRDKITDITGISAEDVKDKPLIGEILQDFFRFVGDNVLIGHSLIYDFSFIMQAAYDNKMYDKFDKKWYGIDTLKIARKYILQEEKKTLTSLCEKYNIPEDGHHRALNDAIMTHHLYVRLCEEFEKDGELFKAEEYIYKPKKDRPPSKREVRNVEKLIKLYGIEPKADIYKMSQSDLNRYADYIRLKRYNPQDN